jgi:hypothetical protein
MGWLERRVEENLSDHGKVGSERKVLGRSFTSSEMEARVEGEMEEAVMPTIKIGARREYIIQERKFSRSNPR